MWWLIAGWLKPSRTPARVKLPTSTMVLKMSSGLVSSMREVLPLRTATRSIAGTNTKRPRRVPPERAARCSALEHHDDVGDWARQIRRRLLGLGPAGTHVAFSSLVGRREHAISDLATSQKHVRCRRQERDDEPYRGLQAGEGRARRPARDRALQPGGPRLDQRAGQGAHEMVRRLLPQAHARLLHDAHSHHERDRDRTASANAGGDHAGPRRRL